jgi:hypothetical protein
MGVTALAFLLTGCWAGRDGDPSGGPELAEPIHGPLVPTEGVLLGAWVKPTEGWQKPDQKAALREFEELIGRRLDLVHHYVPAGRPLGWNAAWYLSRGQIPLITWGGLPSDEVVSGDHDRYIATFARSVASLGAPVFLRYGAEMDGQRNRDWAGDAATFGAAWRRMHDLFGDVPVVWVWAPNASAFADGRAIPYYPGDRYVDWIAADGFNWNGCRGDPWERFEQIFGPFYAWGSSTGKPLMVSETGTVEDPSDPMRKADWLRGVGSTIARMPALKAFLYFHSDRDCPWWLHSSTASLQAFRDLAHGPTFAPGTA